MYERFIKVNRLHSCKQFLPYNLPSKHFGQSLMSETNPQNLQLRVITDCLLQCLNKPNYLWRLVIDRERTTRQDDSIQLHVLLNSGVLAFENVVSFPLVALIVEDAGEEANEVHFGFDEVCSQLGECEVDNSYFLCFLLITVL